MKTVVTMTSWAKRISHVGLAIFRFMTTQTVKPDVFYLWLCEAEFPNREQDLPKDVLLTCNFFNVRIRWTKENEFCFKRWYVYPDHYNDLVVSIDDDQFYDPDLIETIVHYYNSQPTPAVISFQEPGTVDICGINYEYKPLHDWQTRNTQNFFLGQCAFAPNSFPLDTLKPDVVRLRKIYCPKCDESILHPFLIYNSTPIGFCSPHQKMKEDAPLQINGLINEMHRRTCNINGVNYKRTSLLKYIVLHIFPYLQPAWLQRFPNYEINKFKLSMEDLVRML